MIVKLSSCQLCLLPPADEDQDFTDVLKAVIEVAGRWKDLGITLGLHIGHLDCIQFNNPHSARNCLCKMLLEWLERRYNVSATLQPCFCRNVPV